MIQSVGFNRSTIPEVILICWSMPSLVLNCHNPNLCLGAPVIATPTSLLSGSSTRGGSLLPTIASPAAILLNSLSPFFLRIYSFKTSWLVLVNTETLTHFPCMSLTFSGTGGKENIILEVKYGAIVHGPNHHL